MLHQNHKRILIIKKRFIILIVTALVTQITGQIASTNHSSSRSKVVGGTEVKISDVPFLLSFHSRRDGFICGAVIVSARWGMTALHCLKPGSKSARYYFVRAGSSINVAGGSVHRLRKLYSYDSTFFDGKSIPTYDIVLFKVVKPFRFSNNVKPAKLPREGSVLPKSLSVSGWGRSDMSGEARLDMTSSVFLQKAQVSRVDWKDCIEATSWYEWIVDDRTHLCYGEASADACYGDSGGPLADSTTVYGIVSFGDGCGISPGVYTKVLYYRRWIKRIIKL